MRTWITRNVLTWVKPPRLADVDQNRIAGILHYVLLTIIFGALVNIITILVGAVLASRAVFPVVIVLVCLISFLLVHNGRVRPPSLLITASLWVITTLSAGTGLGLRMPSFSFYVMVIVLAAVLLGDRAAFVFAALSILSGLGMAYLEGKGQLTQSLPPAPGPTLTLFATLFLGVATVLYMTARNIRATIARLEASEQNLAERNRQLEHEMAVRQRAEAERNNLFDLSLDVLAALDGDGAFRHLNRACESVLGYTESEMLGKSLSDFSHPNDHGLIGTMLDRLSDGVQITDFESRALRKDGQPRLLSWNARPAAGMIFAIARDVTDRKQAEQNQMELAVAIDKASFLTEFLATMSHDIKTPLTTINASLFLLERLDDPAKQHDKMEEIREQTRRIDRLIQDILTVSRLDHDATLVRRPVDLNSLLSDVMRRLSSKADHRRIDLDLALAQDFPPISADYDQMDRVFTNLIENALNYTPDSGSVHVRALAESGKIEVDIADTGIGIRRKDLPHIFDRYYRSDEARSFDKGGSGLGLAIVKKILDIHGGAIKVTSRPGKGTTFRVQLPVTPSVAA